MGTLTINTTAEQDQRLQDAWTAKLGLLQPATAAQIKADIIEHIKGVVHSYETAQAAVAAADAVTPMPDPT